MSASVAGLLDRGTSPNTEAALVKDVGTAFERELPEIARRLVQVEASLDDLAMRSRRRSHTSCCTRPPIRCVAARAKSCAASSPAASDCVEQDARMTTTSAAPHPDAEDLSAIVLEQADRLFRGEVTKQRMADADRGAWPSAIWQAVEQAGLPLALVPEAQGGAGLPGRRAATNPPRRLSHPAGTAAGDHGRRSALGRGGRRARRGRVVPGSDSGGPVHQHRAQRTRLHACKGGPRAFLGQPRWATCSSMRGTLPEQDTSCCFSPPRHPSQPNRNLANEARDTLLLDSIQLPAEAVRPAPPSLR